MDKVINNICDEEIIKQGQLVRNIYCEECEYETGRMRLKDGVFKLNMEGGYFMYDGEGGALTCCPICKKDTLITED
ncbi:hypothetical protein UT300003_32580 [Clostridium sardiniense]